MLPLPHRLARQKLVFEYQTTHRASRFIMFTVAT